jgi:hypothetical protein
VCQTRIMPDCVTFFFIPYQQLIPDESLDECHLSPELTSIESNIRCAARVLRLGECVYPPLGSTIRKRRCRNLFNARIKTKVRWDSSVTSLMPSTPFLGIGAWHYYTVHPSVGRKVVMGHVATREWFSRFSTPTPGPGCAGLVPLSLSMAANSSSVNTANIITALGNAFKDPSGAALPNDRLAAVLIQNMNQLNDLAKQGKLNQQQIMQVRS